MLSCAYESSYEPELFEPEVDAFPCSRRAVAVLIRCFRCDEIPFCRQGGSIGARSGDTRCTGGAGSDKSGLSTRFETLVLSSRVVVPLSFSKAVATQALLLHANRRPDPRHANRPDRGVSTYLTLDGYPLDSPYHNT